MVCLDRLDGPTRLKTALIAWSERARSFATARWRLLAGAAAGFAVLATAVAVAEVSETSPTTAPSAPSAAAGFGPITPCSPRAASDESTPGRLSIRLDETPLAELLRAAGVAPAEVYRVRRALESIPGFVGIEPGRFVATRAADTGAIQAFEIRTATWVYRGRSTGADPGELVAERTTAPPEARLCAGIVALNGTLEESVVASGFGVDLAAQVERALASRVDVRTLGEAAELRVVAREVDALGGFAGYDGLAAVEVRPKDGATMRVYGVRGEVDMGYLDADGDARPAPAVQATHGMRATLFVRRAALDTALDAAVRLLVAPPPTDVGTSDERGGAETPEDAEQGAAEEPDLPPSGEDLTRTVAQAAKATCSTRIVAGLSKQIIAEARCLNADAFARIPPRKNLRASSNVFLFLEAPARDGLLRVLDKNPGRTLTVNSALRTVAQQVLLSKWGETRRCGVKLAALPSESNHESGLALDVRDATSWRKALEAEGFKWLGRKDPVHFDYAGPGAVDHRGLDVRAFQRLWTRNHRADPLPETGKLDDKTQQRLLGSPASGFPAGARCD